MFPRQKITTARAARPNRERTEAELEARARELLELERLELEAKHARAALLELLERLAAGDVPSPGEAAAELERRGARRG